MSSAIHTAGPTQVQTHAVESILRGLPEWFGIESALQRFVRDAARLPTFVARLGADHAGDVIGFTTVRQHYETSAEIHVAGVLPEYHRQGVGRALLECTEAWLRERGVEDAQVMMTDFPGGDGISSESVLRILEREYESAGQPSSSAGITTERN